MRFSIFTIIFVGILTSAFVAHGQMSSTNFEIQWDSVGIGGADTSSSTNYELRDTGGNSSIGNSSSTSYQVASGYRAGIFDQIITFDVFAQNNASERAATGLSGTTVTTSTAGLSIGDLVVVVQDKGATQVSGIGRIASIGAGTIILDELKDSGTTPVFDGSNDYVYRLSGTSANLGDIVTSAISTSVIGFDVSADLDGGYVIQVYEDGNLRDGANDINDVADTAVSTGSEEYGGRSSDTSLSGSTFDTQDTAFTTTYQDVADESATSFESRNFVTLKACISGTTPNGNYGHVLTFIVSGNY
ncbi:hypothetical protein KJ611_03470 [Patescibacteria group bacterium]|nr:hypothetical protein [Patescibacteria group bacterium]MBU1705779.1 hypothetical protein [Patescibacteria group bacterium]